VGLCPQYIEIKANKIYGCQTLNLSGYYMCSRVKHFWPLKCVNWNLGACQLPEVCWKGCLGRVGRGRDGATSVASFFIFPSFRGLHDGLCHKGPRPNTVDVSIPPVLTVTLRLAHKVY
jgi:hypothetical protein